MTRLEKKSRSSEQSPELLEEVIAEILSRLPAKSLLRFRSVSKSWRSLIGKKYFIKNHLQNIRKNTTYAHLRVVFSCTRHGLKQRSFQSYRDERSADPSPFDDPKNNHLTIAGTIFVGHCHGVLCVLKKPGSFFLWNPTTRISIELPKLELTPMKYGFGWDEGSDAYKVFAVVSDQGQNVGKVYSSKTNSWKTVDHGCLSLYGKYGNCGVFAGGKIYWLKEGGRQIETFDLKSEVFGMMDIPCKPEVGQSMRLLTNETNERFVVVCQNCPNNTNRAWSMNEHEGKESWVEKVLTCYLFPCCSPVCYYIESIVSPNSEEE